MNQGGCDEFSAFDEFYSNGLYYFVNVEYDFENKIWKRLGFFIFSNFPTTKSVQETRKQPQRKWIDARNSSERVFNRRLVHRDNAFASLLNYILSQSHWHNQYTTGGNQFPIMKKYLAIMINPSRFSDNITSDIITRANEITLSNLYAWCESADGNMIISDELLPLDSARRYCEGYDF